MVDKYIAEMMYKKKDDTAVFETAAMSIILLDAMS